MGEEVTRGPRVAVIGGGISGLAAAWFLRAELGTSAQITVFDKAPRVGGHLRVSEVGGVPVDEGAESLLARRPEAVDLVRAVGLADDIVTPAPVGARLWSRGRMVAMPAGTVMGVPRDVSALDGLLDPGELAVARSADQQVGMPIDGDVAIGAFVAARLGPAVVERLVDPLLGGVYAGRASALSLDATVPALGAAAREHASLHAAVAAVQAAGSGADTAAGGNGGATTVGPVFAGVRGGIGRLPEAVATSSGAVIETGATVRDLRRTASGWQLVTGPVPAPQVFTADAVVVAVPAAPAARLLGEVVPAAAAELGAIETASMAIVTLAVPAEAFPEPPTSSGYLVPPVDGRTVKAVTYSSVKWPWLGERAGALVLLRASIGRVGEVADLQRDDDELVDVVLRELAAASGLSGSPVDARVTRWGGALPQYAVGHLDRVRRIRAAVEAVPGLAVCGAVYDGVGVAACIAAAAKAARRVAADVSGGRVRIGA